MSHRFDATLKDMVVTHPVDFAAAFASSVIEPVTPLNVDLSTISAATDAALGIGDPIREIVDLNFQSGPDAGLPARLHLYNAALHARHDVAVRSILILLRQKADAPNLTGMLSYGADDHRLEFRYRVVRLWQEPVETYLTAGLAVLPLATLCRMPPGKTLTETLREMTIPAIDRRLAKESNHAEALRLMTATYILAGLRIKKGDLASIFRGVGLMEETTAFDEYLEEGELRGEIKRSHRVLLRQGHKRFGPPDEAIEAEVTAIKDLERLERLTDAILTANSWRELLDTP